MRLFLLVPLILYLNWEYVFSQTDTKLANYTVIGNPTVIENYPSVVFLGRCVGVLVSPQFILTAGHCIHLDMKMLKASIGHTHKSSGKKQKITKAYRHPKFTRAQNSTNYDAALLKLASPVVLSDRIQVSEMARSTDVFAPGTICSIAGWGSLSRSEMQRTTQLHTALVQIAKPSLCHFDNIHFDVDSELCLKSIPGVNESAAPGDSGAPLWCPRPCDQKLVIAGVDSRGILPDDNQTLDIFTKISYHREWINFFMNNI